MRAFAALMLLAACGPAKPVTYGGELTLCNQTAKTCDESIACENEVRAKYKREPRDPSKGCK